MNLDVNVKYNFLFFIRLVIEVIYCPKRVKVIPVGVGKILILTC